MNIFIDIDGTLTDSPKARDGRVIPKRIRHVRRLIRQGHRVFIWSAAYGCQVERVVEFCKVHGLKGATPIGKPDLVVDDNPEIRPGGLKVRAPEEFFT